MNSNVQSEQFMEESNDKIKNVTINDQKSNEMEAVEDRTDQQPQTTEAIKDKWQLLTKTK